MLAKFPLKCYLKLSLFLPADVNKVDCGSVNTNHHALAVQVVKLDPDEVEGGSSEGRLSKAVECGVDDGEHSLAARGVGVDFGATCVCNCVVRDPVMLKCSICEVEEHGPCYRIVEESEAPDQHCCLRCSEETDGVVCTDPKLVRLAAKKPELVVNTCIFRRMLVVLRTEDVEDMHELVNRLGVDQDIGAQLFRKVLDDDIVSSANGVNFMIYEENIQKAMGKHFGGKWKKVTTEAVNNKQTQGAGSTVITRVEDQGLSHPGASEGNTCTQKLQQQWQGKVVKDTAARSGH